MGLFTRSPESASVRDFRETGVPRPPPYYMSQWMSLLVRMEACISRTPTTIGSGVSVQAASFQRWRAPGPPGAQVARAASQGTAARRLKRDSTCLGAWTSPPMARFISEIRTTAAFAGSDRMGPSRHSPASGPARVIRKLQKGTEAPLQPLTCVQSTVCGLRKTGVSTLQKKTRIKWTESAQTGSLGRLRAMAVSAVRTREMVDSLQQQRWTDPTGSPKGRREVSI